MSDPSREHLEEHPFFDAMYEQFAARPLPSGRRPWWRGRRLPAGPVWRPVSLAGAGVALAAVIAALVIVLGASGADPSPAYGVTVNSNNSITIYLRQAQALGKLNARLARLGLRIRVVPIVHGCVAPVHHVVYSQADSNVPTHVAPGPVRTLEVKHISPSAGQHGLQGPAYGGALTIYNNTLPGRTRIFTITRSGGWTGNSFTVVGAAPRCVGDGR